MDFLFSTILAIILGVLSSFIAALLYFYLFFLRLKPNLSISKEICKREGEDGLMEYEIKVVNNNRRRSTVNVRAELLLVTRRNAPGGMILHTDPLPLKRSDIFEITRFDPKDNPSEDEARYAFRFLTVQPGEKGPTLENLWEDDTNTYLLFRMFATDPLSGLGKVFPQEYYKKSDIIEGDFGFGPSLQVIRQEGKNAIDQGVKQHKKRRRGFRFFS